MSRKNVTVAIGAAIGLVAAIIGASVAGNSTWPLVIAGIAAAIAIIGVAFARR